LEMCPRQDRLCSQAGLTPSERSSDVHTQALSGLPWLGICDSPAYVGEPPCNGCAERFVRTLKEQCIWSRPWRDVEELREAVRAFVELYNTCWLVERHGHRTPREASMAATKRGCGMMSKVRNVSKEPGPVQALAASSPVPR